MQGKPKRQKLILLSILLMLLLFYPFITVANKMQLVGGFPVLYLYIFGMWIAAIIAMYMVTDKTQ